MKTFHEEIPDLCQDALTDQLFDEHSIFFDIETTGFSPAASTLYMIGCARRKSNRICIDQFFAEKPEEEAEILAAFFQMLSPYTTIITFNGVGFDIPYLKAKADHYKFPEHFRDFEYLDIFKSVSSIIAHRPTSCPFSSLFLPAPIHAEIFIDFSPLFIIIFSLCFLWRAYV